MGLFVRKMKTASGAIAVQIAQKHRGVRTIIEHIGSGHTETEITALVHVAKTKIAGDQQELDFEIPDPQSQTESQHSVTPIGPRVTGSSAKLLWNVLEDAYEHLGVMSRDVVLAPARNDTVPIQEVSVQTACH
ncbi:hypothetical protein [Citricoccus sp. NR2]|uniref:hypothetical protein n=1 Tax=Citricoccus sp. NR2 TaxID=3004095 RepID=UPI0022DDF738|nr:hypothetical protein [Citricoccus sp. NR2]WBL19813.1 hypothetical protein O1A05_03725 [Citricoccus sp. NR2]